MRGVSLYWGEAEVRARQLDDRARLGRVLARMVTVRMIVGDVKGCMRPPAGPRAGSHARGSCPARARFLSPGAGIR